MVKWLGIVLETLRSAVRTYRDLALENLALRQQLAVARAAECAAAEPGQSGGSFGDNHLRRDVPDGQCLEPSQLVRIGRLLQLIRSARSSLDSDVRRRPRPLAAAVRFPW